MSGAVRCYRPAGADDDANPQDAGDTLVGGTFRPLNDARSSACAFFHAATVVL